VQFVAADVQQGRHALLRRVHLLAGAARGRKIIVGLDLGLPVIAVQPRDGLPAGVGAAGVLEVRETLQRRFAEGGKLAAYIIEVEVAHRSCSLRGAA
jgi:hypothetical protein